MISEYRPEYDGNPSCAACGTIMVRGSHILGWQCKSCGSTEPDPATPAPKIEDPILPVAVKPGEPFTPPAELSDYDIQMIHAGLMIPNERAIHSMSREIRKWRGVQNPDLI